MKALLSILFLLGLFAAIPVMAQGDGLTPAQIDTIARSVVLIVTLQNGEPYATGSGTIASADGLIFTNSHVLEGGDDFAILMLDDINEQPVFRYYASIVAAYDDMDFAILRIDRDAAGQPVSGLNLPFIDISTQALNSSVPPSRGDKLYIFGYPDIGDGYLVLTNGTVTTIQNGTVGSVRMPVWYQTDAEIAPGNSGGLAVNAMGIPVGIPTQVTSEADTGGRLGGILPFSAILARMEADSATVTELPERQPFPGRVTGAPNLALACATGERISNGTTVTVVQMRPGFTYQATVIGLNGFDPILIVANLESESVFCNDDSNEALSYTADIPGVGPVRGQSTDAHLRFTQDYSDMADMALIVGGYDGSGGEFILILEGMAVTPADQEGDPFMVLLTDSVIQSGAPVNVYMIGNENKLDPIFGAVIDDFSDYMVDSTNNPIACDDAGSGNGCWGLSSSLATFSLTNAEGIRVRGDEYDAMLSLSPVEMIQSGNQAVFFLMSGYNSTGSYTLIFHMGVR